MRCEHDVQEAEALISGKLYGLDPLGDSERRFLAGIAAALQWVECIGGEHNALQQMLDGKTLKFDVQPDSRLTT